MCVLLIITLDHSKNQYRHSVVSEESLFFHSFLKKRSFGLQPQDDGESESMLTITLYVILSKAKNLILLINFSPDVFLKL
jgi:hypothetical protein